MFTGTFDCAYKTVKNEVAKRGAYMWDTVVYSDALAPYINNWKW